MSLLMNSVIKILLLMVVIPLVGALAKYGLRRLAGVHVLKGAFAPSPHLPPWFPSEALLPRFILAIICLADFLHLLEDHSTWLPVVVLTSALTLLTNLASLRLEQWYADHQNSTKT